MAEIRWFRIAITTVILIAIFAAVSYFQIKNNPVNATDIDLMMQGCAVNFAPNGESEIIKFGDSRCPK
jgi:hypothetical protein